MSRGTSAVPQPPLQGATRGNESPPLHLARPRSNTNPRTITFLGFTLTDEQRRVAFNTLVITSLSISCVFALAGAYAGLFGDEFLTGKSGNPWMVAFPSILSAGLVVFTYAWGGLLRHGENYGWAFFQPGRGGTKFVALQTGSWTCVAFSLTIPWVPWAVEEVSQWNLWPKNSPRHNGALLVVSSAIGVIAQLLTVTSLFAYRRPSQSFTWRTIFTERADAKSFIYFFMSVQTAIAVYAVAVLFITEHFQDFFVGSTSTLAYVALIATTTSLTHGVGGPWLKGNEGFTAFQPGRGGTSFIAMQFAGWSTFSLCLIIGITRVVSMMSGTRHPVIALLAHGLLPEGATALGILGLFSQLILTLSLFVFEESEYERANRYYRTKRLNERHAWLSCYTGLPPEVKRHVYDYL